VLGLATRISTLSFASRLTLTITSIDEALEGTMGARVVAKLPRSGHNQKRTTAF
jgi:hypothetical protein